MIGLDQAEPNRSSTKIVLIERNGFEWLCAASLRDINT